jgi:hypothetical protein
MPNSVNRAVGRHTMPSDCHPRRLTERIVCSGRTTVRRPLTGAALTKLPIRP